VTAFAGVYEPAGLSSEEERLRVARAALAGEGEVSASALGPLALAWTGPGSPGAGPFCLLAGELHQPGHLRGLPDDELLARLRGEFALLVWDPRKRRGLLARDQLGERSLFVHDDGTRLVFGTEVRQLLRALPRNPGPDDLALARWLAGRPTEDGRTLYEGLRSVPPGCRLELAPGERQTRPYWRPSYRPPEPIAFDDAAGAVRDALERAVERRLRPTEATGVMLSGGLDSTSLAAAAVSLPGGEGLRAYSAVFPDHPEVDESELIELTARNLEIEGTRTVARAGGALAGALGYLDEWRVPPPPPAHFLWQPLVERAAADGTTRLIDGEGGDELFGVAPYLLADRLRRGRVAGALRLGARFPGTGDRARLRVVAHLMRNYGVRGALPPWLDRSRLPAPDWLAPGPARLLAQDDPIAWKRAAGPRWWAQLSHMVATGPDAVGACDYFRRRAASAGASAHHPLLDVDLIELVLGLPPELSFSPGLDRPLLRAAMHGRLPECVRLRSDKSVFNSFVDDCLTGPDLRPIQHLLRSPDAELRAHVDSGLIDRLLAEPPNDHRTRLAVWSGAVWRLATAECWLRTHADAAFPARMPSALGLAPAKTRLEPFPGPGPTFFVLDQPPVAATLVETADPEWVRESH
jgi:asparagine synthase (glutamine-hydrolysing)